MANDLTVVCTLSDNDQKDLKKGPQYKYELFHIYFTKLSYVEEIKMICLSGRAKSSLESLEGMSRGRAELHCQSSENKTCCFPCEQHFFRSDILKREYV